MRSLGTFFLLVTSCLWAVVSSTPIVYDGRARFNLTAADLDASKDPYLTVVKGTKKASEYSTLLGLSVPPTPLWQALGGFIPLEQTISMTIDNSSIFSPGGNPQNGFRRGEFIAQKNGSNKALNAATQTGITVYHFSIKLDERFPLDYNHEYQIVFIEPDDGSHVFGIQLGSPFTNPTGPLPAKDARSFKVLDHGLNVLFTTPFTARHWHNFAVQVDWDKLTLGVFYSQDGLPLRAVTTLKPNKTAKPGPEGQGDFHFGFVKLPLVNPKDTPEQQNDVVHFGIQGGRKEGLLYSGIFFEKVDKGVSVGYGKTIKPITK